MKKVLSVFLILVMVFALASCGANKSLERGANKSFEPRYDYNNGDSVLDKKSDSSLDSENGTTYLKDNVKLIYKARIDAETNDFDKALAELKSAVNEFKGYFEKSEVDTSSYYQGNAAVYGQFKIRIPQESYEKFIDKVSGGAHVVSITETVDDIGLQYYEVETRIETLKIEISRLQDFLREADNMSDIITLEKALSEAEYDLSTYTTQKAKYDSLVNYSTIEIYLRQTSNYTPTNVSFWQELGSNLSEGFDDFVSWLRDFAFFLSYNLITIVIIVVLVVLCIKFKWIKKLRTKFSRKKAKKSESDKPDDHVYKEK